MHQAVLLKPVLQYLQPRVGDTYLDVTAGYGGHAGAIINQTAAPQKAVLVDRDAQAVQALKKIFQTAGTQIIHSDFLAASRELVVTENQFDLILADLGVSSPHLENAARGFSFTHDAPLDMRMDQAAELSALTVVNQWREADLAKILSEYGQEPKARQIAHNIVTQRPLTTTSQLADLAAKAWPGYSRVHPATRTFQAIRIAVNDELKQLEESLPLWLQLLKPGGRLAVISFHSLEDRIVKAFFAEHAKGYDAELELLTKKPIVAAQDEIVSNPRARSAKLRAAAKIKTNRKE